MFTWYQEQHDIGGEKKKKVQILQVHNVTQRWFESRDPTGEKLKEERNSQEEAESFSSSWICFLTRIVS